MLLLTVSSYLYFPPTLLAKATQSAHPFGPLWKHHAHTPGEILSLPSKAFRSLQRSRPYQYGVLLHGNRVR